MRTYLTASRLFAPIEAIDSPLVIMEDGLIESVSTREATAIPVGGCHLDFPDLVIAPGYIDIHVHGGAGHDVMQDDPSGRIAFEKALARHGVTSYLATTVTAPMDRILGALDRLGNAITAEELEDNYPGARPLGIHLEGPFISAAKCGVHPTEYLLDPSPKRFGEIWDASGGTLKMMTIAPELSGATETIAAALERGVYSSMGHSNATFAQTESGMRAGAVSATHTFNAMRALDHREPGIVGAVLSEDGLMADIIVDGIHVASAVVEVFLRAKGLDKSILITDAISATGMPDGFYQLGPFQVEVRGERCEYQGRLAGSVLTLDRAVRNVMQFADWSLQQSIILATRNPALLIGAENKGTVEAGKDADLVLLTAEGEVRHTIIAGRRI